MTKANCNSSGPTPHVLWQQMKAGDFSAFETIYKDHIQSLLQYGLKINPSADLVKDTIHDLFVEIWNQRTNLSNTTHIEFYLIKALRNKLYRAAGNPKVFFTGNDLHFDREYTPSFDDSITQPEWHQQSEQLLRKAIDKLPLRQQEVVYLRFYKGYTIQQIAELLHINYQSVANLVQRALRSLKKDFPVPHQVILSLLVNLLLFFS